MTIVEHIKPGFHWAEPFENNEFKVEQRGSLLEIVGLFPAYREPELQSDVISLYEQFPSAMAKVGQMTVQSPEILFANAETDEKRIAFVRKFGPVIASQVTDFLTVVQKREKPEFPGRLIAQQDLQELKNEQAIYRAALALVNWLTSTMEDPQDLGLLFEVISANIKDWPRQWKREKNIRGTKPIWKLHKMSLERIDRLALRPGPDTRNRALEARIIICELLNSFPSTAFPNPLAMHSYIKFGIRPLLYSILRRHMFFPRGFGECLNTECRNFFSIERAGQQFCSAECSLRQRQRDYWQTTGKRLRKKRTAKRRKGK